MNNSSNNSTVQQPSRQQGIAQTQHRPQQQQQLQLLPTFED
jgi:hypothetical protein